jgi:hypothetical protein
VIPANAKYKKTETVVLKAIPDSGSFFAGWTGAFEGVGDGECSVVVNEDMTVGTIFETGCEYSFMPDSTTLGYGGGKINLNVTAQSAGFYPAPKVDDTADWVTYTMSAFTKNKGAITLTVAKNTQSAARSANLFIGGNLFVMNQTGKPWAFGSNADPRGFSQGACHPGQGGAKTFPLLLVYLSAHHR